MSDVSSKTPDAPQQPAPTHGAFAGVKWGVTAAIVITIVSFFFGQLLAAVIIGFLPSAWGWSSEQLTDWLNSVAGQFVFVLVAEALTVGILWAYLRRCKASIKSLGFHRKPIARDVGYMVLGFVAYFGMLIAATMLAGGLFNLDVEQQQELGFNDVTTTTQKLMAFVSLVVLPPIVEEVVFRGFLYGGLRTKMGLVGATLLTSLLFAAPHLLASKDGGLLWIAFVDTFVLSFVLCYLREKTGNLWASIGVHALKNGLAFLYLFILVS